MSKTKITVRYAETDQMGVVHHANYYLYFEVAREDLIKESGISYKEFEEMGVMMPLVETNCRYIEAAKYYDDIIVIAQLGKVTPVKLEILYEIRRESDERLLAKGYTLQTFVDSQSFKILNLKKSNPELWEKCFK